MRPATLALAKGVFAADVRGDLVFLDARANQYSCVARSQLGGADQLGDDLIEVLEAAGLAARESAGSPELESFIPAAVSDRISKRQKQPVVRAAHLLLLLAAASRMAAHLVLRQPCDWLRHAPKAAAKASSKGELDHALALAGTLELLRPLVPRSGRCVPSSILLLQFLKLRGVEAQWVFGVRTYPFEAHCWVQKDGVVLNDTLEHVRWFTPIALA